MFKKNLIYILLILALFSLEAADKKAESKPVPHSRAECLARPYPELPDDVTRKAVTIWSDGVRMAADLYLPKGVKKDEKLPTIIIVNGTGGVKRKLPARLAPRFAKHGYAVLGFDYRGWGESESRLMVIGDIPNPDANEEVTVKAKALRWQMDFADQAMDVRNCISFLQGEPNIDPNRIGLFGTSYGGGLSTWVAGNDFRVKCLVIQVPGMGRMRHEGNVKGANHMAMKQTRAETEPVPVKTNKIGKEGSKYGHMRRNLAKWVGYNPLAAAETIKAPTLIIDAGADELLNWEKNGKVVADTLKKNGVTVKHQVFKDMTHYGVYSKNLDMILKLEVDWFDKHLKPTK